MMMIDQHFWQIVVWVEGCYLNVVLSSIDYSVSQTPMSLFLSDLYFPTLFSRKKNISCAIKGQDSSAIKIIFDIIKWDIRLVICSESDILHHDKQYEPFYSSFVALSAHYITTVCGQSMYLSFSLIINKLLLSFSKISQCYRLFFLPASKCFPLSL